MVMKKGFFFSTDALLAVLIIFASAASVTYLYLEEKPRAQLSYLSEDIMSVLTTVKVKDLENPYLAILIANGTVISNESTIIEEIGLLWATGNKEIASELARNISAGLVPDGYGVSFVMGNETLYSNAYPLDSELSTHKSLITGIEESKPIKGTTVRIYLSDVGKHVQTEYIYFGGFTGQGNITRFYDRIPADAIIEKMSLELSAGSNFSLYINSEKCNDLNISVGNMSADNWDLSYCNASIVPGVKNNITITFDSMDNAYIAGGFMRIDFITNDLYSKNIDSDRYYFPGISGMANLYSSISIPGTLNSMNVYLHFKSDYATYLSIGDRTVFNGTGNGTPQSVFVSNASLTSFPVLLDYSELSNTTVPIRFASFNTTLQTLLTESNADIILITDLSGSMKCRMGQWDCPPVGNAIPNCKASDLADPNSRRLGVAGCLDSQINNIVLNASIPAGNRLWLVDFSENANPFYSNIIADLIHDNIESEIVDRYKSKNQNEISGGTCIACGLNQAYQIFSTYSDESRKRYIVMLTDGIPTYCTGGYWVGIDWRCDTSSTGTTRQWPAWWQGASCDGTQSDCNGNDCLGPADNAINAAQRLHDELNVTIHAAGMGPLEDCSMANYTIAKIAEAGNGTYFVSQNASALFDFYQTIGQKILESAELSSQTLVLKGNVSPSILYSDSYIEFNYSAPISPVVHGEVPIYYHSPDFQACNAEVQIPNSIRIIDARIISYSGIHWTDHVGLQNSNGTFEVFNLSRFSADYSRLGDPFVVSIPPHLIKPGEINNFTIRTADSPVNLSGCSENNSLIYTAMINLVNATPPYEEVFPKAEGCTWHIEHETGGFMELKVPYGYSGLKVCEYTSLSHSTANFDQDDSYDAGMYEFLVFVDYNNDGRVFIDFDEGDLVITTKVVRDIPYLWGPTLAEVRVWK